MSRMLELALRPALPQLSHPQTEEFLFNRPGEAWWLRTGCKFERIEMPEMNFRRLHGIATLAAAQKRQTIGRRATIMGDDVAVGSTELRLHVVMPPSVPRETVAMCFRRHSDEVSPIEALTARYDTAVWNKWVNVRERKAEASAKLLAFYDTGDISGFMRALAAERRTPLFCGRTGAGKTYLLKTYIQLLPSDARIIVIEDAKEAVIPQPNHVRLFYSDGGLSGGATIQELMRASLRLRPEFVVLQEMRTSEAAWVFMDEVLSGHPGSPTTIHGRSPHEAAKRLFDYVKASDAGCGMDDATVRSLLCSAVDCIIPLSESSGVRSIKEVWFKDDAARRGESFTNLLEDD